MIAASPFALTVSNSPARAQSIAGGVNVNRSFYDIALEQLLDKDFTQNLETALD